MAEHKWLVGGFKPFEKYAHQNGIFPKFRGEHKKKWNHQPERVNRVFHPYKWSKVWAPKIYNWWRLTAHCSGPAGIGFLHVQCLEKVPNLCPQMMGKNGDLPWYKVKSQGKKDKSKALVVSLISHGHNISIILCGTLLRWQGGRMFWLATVPKWGPSPPPTSWFLHDHLLYNSGICCFLEHPVDLW